jgi:hypothetical protein
VSPLGAVLNEGSTCCAAPLQADGLAMVALVEVFIRVSTASSTTFTRSQYPTSLKWVTLA